MKILITGGAGFIASHIAEAYLAAGHDVVICDDLSTGRKENIPPQARFFNISINSPEIFEIFKKEKFDVVNHHAAQIDVRKSVSNPQADVVINIIGSLNLLEACKNTGVKKFILASTGGAIYGEQSYFPADEKHPTEPKSPYGIAKLAVEKYLQFYFWTYGLSFVILRYANVYGPRQNSKGEAGVVAIFTEKLLKGEAPTINGDGKQTRDYVFVGDVVACNVEALKAANQGIFNVGTGIETDVNQLAQELMRLTDQKNDIKHGPSLLGEQLRSCLKQGALQKSPPIPLSEGLRKTVNSFRNKN